MKTIWKFELEQGVQRLRVPEGATFLSAEMQHGQLCLWAIVDPTAKKVPRGVQVIGTGHPFFPEGLKYINTVIDGLYVWHVFEEEQ